MMRKRQALYARVVKGGRGRYAIMALTLPFEINSRKVGQLIFERARISSPEKFGNLFSAGDKALRVHLHPAGNNAMQMARLLKLVNELIPRLKAKGYAGFFGDTKNPVLIKSLTQQGAIEISPPEKDRVKAEKIYRHGVKRFNWSAKYLRMPVRRLIFRFQ